jgi:L-asparaginase / beta-aspartyl-peptidase
MQLVPKLVVHGGAGRYPDELHDAARAGCDAATRAGLDVLARGGSAVDAVVAAVRALEDDPLFNAGVGSVLTREGLVEADAAIMEGTRLCFGGVAAMPNARQPIDIARAVMDQGEHVLLCAEGAWAFARERGFVPCDAAELITARARERLQAEAERRGPPAPDHREHRDPGTVGACAVDAGGHVAAATSTGGMTYKRRGRIGDTPLCGCGTYADDRGGAASATGEGEAIIRVTMTRVCVDHMRGGASASEAAWRAVDALGEDVRGQGGIICCDRLGRIGAAHNSPSMAMGAGALTGAGVAVVTSMTVEPGSDLFAALMR